MKLEIITHSVEETRNLGQKIAKCLSKGDVITLDGDLGAGKTTFTQGVGLGLNIKQTINSPTFNILKCYFDGILPLYHIDAYRLEDNVNADIGLEEVIQGDGVCLIEWSKFIPTLIFEPLRINIEILLDSTRKFIIESNNEKYQKVFNCLKEAI